MHDKKNATIFSILRQSFAVMWPIKWFKATFEIFVIIINTNFFFLEGKLFNLVVKNTAYEDIDKSFKTWLKN